MLAERISDEVVGFVLNPCGNICFKLSYLTLNIVNVCKNIIHVYGVIVQVNQFDRFNKLTIALIAGSLSNQILRTMSRVLGYVGR